jgi:hypothetical protein
MTSISLGAVHIYAPQLSDISNYGLMTDRNSEMRASIKSPETRSDRACVKMFISFAMQ